MDDPVCPLDYRYGRKELKEIFGETRRLQYLLDVEAALERLLTVSHALVVGGKSKGYRTTRLPGLIL